MIKTTLLHISSLLIDIDTQLMPPCVLLSIGSVQRCLRQQGKRGSKNDHESNNKEILEKYFL